MTFGEGGGLIRACAGTGHSPTTDVKTNMNVSEDWVAMKRIS